MTTETLSRLAVLRRELVNRLTGALAEADAVLLVAEFEDRSAAHVAYRPVRPPEGTRLVLVIEDADTLFFGRSDRGNRLTFVWGEPDENGWYTPTITEHFDEMPRPVLVLPSYPDALDDLAGDETTPPEPVR